VRRFALLITALMAGCFGSDTEPPPTDTCPDTAPEPSPRAPSSERNRLIYVVAVDDLPQLWMIDLDAETPAPVRLDAVGDAPGPLRPTWDDGLNGIWSPAGDLVAVTLDQFMLSVIDVNTPGTLRDLGGVGTLPLVPYGREVGIWSPQGDRLVVLDWNRGDLRVVQADGSGTIDVPGPANRVNVVNPPTWSPDGRHFGVSVYRGEFGGPAEVSVISVEDGAQIGATTVTNSETYLRWGAAGTQLINLVNEFTPDTTEFSWDVTDADAHIREALTVPRVERASWVLPPDGYAPVFSGDGAWMFVPGAPPRIQWRGCGEPVLADAPAWGLDARATADGRHLVFTGPDELEQPERSSAWTAELIDGQWHARRVYTPTGTSLSTVHWPRVARTRSRAAWTMGYGFPGEVFVVTGDDLRDPRTFRADGLDGDYALYAFAPELDRFAYTVGATRTTVRVLDVNDPSAASVLGEATISSSTPIMWMAWSSDGSALAFATADPAGGGRESAIYVTRIRNGVVEPARFLGTTLTGFQVPAQWEP
jgi:Tol biopolymer transport system component